MKLQVVYLITTVAAVDAGISSPSVAVDLKGLQGTSGPFEGLDPLVKWDTSASALGLDFKVGATSSIKPTRDVLSLPKSVWGKVSTTVGSFALSSKATSSLGDSNALSYNLCVDNDDWDTSVEMVSSGGSKKIQLNKGFDAASGRIFVNPRYSFASSDADVVLGYDTDGTSVTLEASTSDQKLTVQQQITDSDSLTPSITSKGKFAVAWKKNLGGGNAVTTTVKVNDSVSVKWQDGPWTAIFDSPMSGFTTEGVNVRVNRKLDFF